MRHSYLMLMRCLSIMKGHVVPKGSICMAHDPRRRAEPGQSQSLTTLGLGCSPLGNATKRLSHLEKYEHFLVGQVTDAQEYRDSDTTLALSLYIYINIFCLFR